MDNTLSQVPWKERVEAQKKLTQTIGKKITKFWPIIHATYNSHIYNISKTINSIKKYWNPKSIMVYYLAHSLKVSIFFLHICYMTYSLFRWPLKCYFFLYFAYSLPSTITFKVFVGQLFYYRGLSK